MATSGSASTIRWFDAAGNPLGPFATLNLDERAAAMVWWALYSAYGNEPRSSGLWARFREAVGADRWEQLVEAGSAVGQE
jgi:hypothetical protein